MITLLMGDNSFELKRALDTIVSAFDGVSEKMTGSDLEISRLPDLLTGMTLFATNRLVVVTDLSENKTIWDVLPEWLPRMGDEIHLVLVEPKPDKRTKTFKDLKKIATVREFISWSDRDTALAESWVITEAKRQGLALDKKLAQSLVDRVGPDQWTLHHALEKLAVLDEVTPQVIEDIITANPSENVFNLLDAALRGDSRRVAGMIHTLQQNQDPYMTFGLLSGQVFQLAAVAVSEKPSGEVAGDIGAHPYAVGKLASHAKKLGRNGARKLVSIFAEADTTMKSTATEPWLLIERALIKTASL
jgi:DNA polymerase III delta subunit